MAKNGPWGPSHPGLRIGIQITAYKKIQKYSFYKIYIFKNKLLVYFTTKHKYLGTEQHGVYLRC